MKWKFYYNPTKTQVKTERRNPSPYFFLSYIQVIEKSYDVHSIEIYPRDVNSEIKKRQKIFKYIEKCVIYVVTGTINIV